MFKYLPVLMVLVISCTVSGPRTEDRAASDIYGGKVFGIYRPLEVKQTEAVIEVSGGTFSYTIERASGQIVSARVLGDEFLAKGTSCPNPYIVLMPENDPGANRTGGADRGRFSFEKAVETRPGLWSGGLTGAWRLDAEKSAEVVTGVVSSDHQSAMVRSSGVYAWPEDGRPTPLAWEIEYLFDVDGFTKVTVRLSTERPVKLRWHCFNHAFFSREAVDFISRYPDLGAPPFDLRPAPTETIGDLGPDQPVLESH